MSSAVLLSLGVAGAATVLSLPFAVAAAWYIERSRGPGRGALQTAVLLPLVLPPVVVGYLLLQLFSPRRALGAALAAAGLPVAFHWLGAVAASAVVGFPLAVMLASVALRAVDPKLELAARSLGRAPWHAFRSVTLPLAWPGILAGAVTSFARGLGEFGATIVLAGRIPGETETLPLKIYAELETPGGDVRVRGMVLASVGLCVAAVLAARALEGMWRRRLEEEA